MAQFGDYLHDRILRQTVEAAAQHTYGATGSSQRSFDPGDVLQMLSPRQLLALHRVAMRADLNGNGSVDYGRVGPRLPTAGARDLKEALHGILAVQAASASAPPERELTEGEQHLDRGLRSLFAEEQLESFTDRNGIGLRGSTGLVQDRTVDSRVHAPAARSMVDNLAKATNSNRRDVLSRLLATPADQRFDLAASMMVGRGDGMSRDHRDHAQNRMARTMNQQFSSLGATANRYNRIGNQWKSRNRLVKGAVYLGVGAAVVAQPWLIPVLVAARFVHPIQRLQRARRELTATVRGSRSVGQARKILDHEHGVAGRLSSDRQAAMVQAPRSGPGPDQQQTGVRPQGGQQGLHIPGVAPDGTDLTGQRPSGWAQDTSAQQAPGQAAYPSWNVQGQPPQVGAPMPAWALQPDGQRAQAGGQLPDPSQQAPQTLPGQVAPGQVAPGQVVPGLDHAMPVGDPDVTQPVVTQPGQPPVQAGVAAPDGSTPLQAAGPPEAGQPQAADEAPAPFTWPEGLAFPGEGAPGADQQAWNTANAGVAGPRAGTPAEAAQTAGASGRPAGPARGAGPAETERH